MRRYTFRTKIEAAVLTLMVAVASFYISIGQADEPAEKGHKTTQCTLCHKTFADITSDEPVDLDLSSKCLTCHEPSKIDDQSKLTFHQSVKRCTDCHSFHNPNEISAGKQSFRFRFDQRSAQRALCYSCHGEGESFTRISDGHRRAAVLFHSNYQSLVKLSPSEACMLCHGENSNLESQFTQGLAVPQFASHNDHPVDVVVTPGGGVPGNRIRQVIDPRLKLFDGKIECQTCHSLSASTKARLIPTSSVTELCNGCHQLD